MTTPWPLHPPPVAGEALSSWIGRIAATLRADPPTLLGGLGHRLDHPDDLDDLDVAIPPGLAGRLAEHTRVAPARIRAMTLTGHHPRLTAGHSPTSRDGFAAYTRTFSILLPPGRRRDRAPQGWRPWISATGPLAWRVCPACLPTDGAPPHAYPLIWAVPIMLTCPIHHRRLEPYGPRPGHYRHQARPTAAAPPVGRAARAMDAHTRRALTTGHALLPGGRATAATWLRLLRTLIDELSATLPEVGTARRTLEQAWGLSGQPTRAGQRGWRIFEQLPATAQEQTLHAAATTIQALRDDTLTPRGQNAPLFQPPHPDPIAPRAHHPARRRHRRRGRPARSSTARDRPAGRRATSILRPSRRWRHLS